jgi:anti-anti-sigma regulatory factor
MNPIASSATAGRSREPLSYSVGDATVIAAFGRITSTSFHALERLANLAREGGCTVLVFDLYEVIAIEPEAVDLLRAALRGGQLRGATLVGLRPALRLALRELDAGDISIRSNMRAALAAAGR